MSKSSELSKRQVQIARESLALRLEKLAATRRAEMVAAGVVLPNSSLAEAPVALPPGALTLIGPAPPKPRRVRPPGPRRPRLDWGRVAALIAQGQTPEQIAVGLGCPAARIWRNHRRSRRFRDRIERERRQLLLQAAWRLTAKAPSIADGLLAGVDTGDLRLLLRLADRLKLQTAGRDKKIVASPHREREKYCDDNGV